MKNLFNALLTIMFFLFTGIFLSSCSVKAPGSRTFNFGPDGATVTSETTTGESTALADIEKEKTRQVCYKQEEKRNAKIEAAVANNPMAVVMWEQSKTINNAMSLMVTGKPYNPCPSSTNSSDVEIADAQMYSNIYREGAGVLKFGLGAWAATDVAGNLFGALGKAGAYTLAASGEGSSISINDSFKSSIFRDGATTGDVFSNPSTVTEMFAPETPVE